MISFNNLNLKSLLCFLIFYSPFYLFSQEISPTLSNYPGGYNISCYGGNNGSISLVVVGGDAPYFFNWSNGSTTKNQTQLAAGSYSVIVTDVSSNTVSMTFDLTQPKAIALIMHPRVYEGGYNILEPGGTDGVIETDISGGIPPYTYSWSNNTSQQNVGDLSAGTYTLTVTDMNGCTSVASSTLIEGTGVQILSITSTTHNGYNVSCHGGEKDGSIQLTVIGGQPSYNFTWNDGYTEKDRTNLGPGYYSVIVRDENGVGDAAQIQLTGPTALQSQLNPTVYSNGKHISCYGCANGHITTIVTGGVPPYTYLWNDGSSTLNRNGLVAGGYNVQITDANGCVAEAGVNIYGPEREDWTMKGNAGTTPVTDFIGTTDFKDFHIKTNGITRLKISDSGSPTFSSLSGTGTQLIQASSDGTISRYPCSVWSTCGNNVLPLDFLGSKNNVDVIFKANLQEVLRLKNYGKVSINEFVGQTFGLLYTDNLGDISKIDFDYGNPTKYLDATGNWSNLPIGLNVWNINGNNIFNSNSGSVGIGRVNVSSLPGAPSSFSTDFYIDGSGRVGINTIPPTTNTFYKLFVDGGIAARDVLVTATNFPDYVFAKDYKLMSIYEYENFITLNKHLPGMPSAQEVNENDGFEIGNMQTKLLEKVEEQALYIINLQRQIDELKAQITYK